MSTLIKWFPDRPGLATGMAIMGFGGGAMVAAPFSRELLERFGGAAPDGEAVVKLFVTQYRDPHAHLLGLDGARVETVRHPARRGHSYGERWSAFVGVRGRSGALGKLRFAQPQIFGPDPCGS